MKRSMAQSPDQDLRMSWREPCARPKARDMSCRTQWRMRGRGGSFAALPSAHA